MGDAVEDPVHGELLDADTWESNPQGPDWLNFSHKRTFVLYLRGLEGREIEEVLPYISPVSNPNKSDQYTLASGNLAEITNVDTNIPGVTPKVRVYNDTCADYWLRVVVHATPKAPGTGVNDAGANDADADVIGDTGAKE